MSHNQTDDLVGTPYSEGFRLVLVIVGTVVFLGGIFGNVLLMVVMYKSQVKKDFPKVFIANLALADLVVVCLLPLTLLDLVLGRQPLVNATHCRVNAAIMSISYCVSIMSLITVSFNRYMKICHTPVFSRIFSTTRRNLAICGGLWALGALLNIPGFFPSLASYGYDSDCHTCNARGNSRTFNYGSAGMILALVLPVGLIGYFNVAIYRRWHKSRKKMQKSGKKRAGNIKASDGKKMKKSAPETNTLETGDSGVGGNGSAESTAERRPNDSNRKMATAELVKTKENPCFETSFTDSTDKGMHMHSQTGVEGMATPAADSEASSAGALRPNSSLTKNPNIGSVSRQARKSPAKTSVKKRVRQEVALVRSLLVISLGLFVLYAPSSVILFLSIFLEDAVPGQFTMFSALLLNINCAINWIIYGAMNTVFRKAYSSVMKSLMFCSRR